MPVTNKKKLIPTERTVERARANSIVSEKEVKKIITSAGTSVSNREAKAIGELYESRIEKFPTPPMPGFEQKGTPENPRVGNAASQAFNTFFVSRNLPFGERADTMRTQINDQLSRSRLGRPLEVKPNIGHLPKLALNPDMFDGVRNNAYVDVRKGHYFLEKLPGGNRPPNTPGPAPKTEYWGPFALPKPEHTVSPERAATLQRKFTRQLPNAVWTTNFTALHEATARVPLKSDSKFTYTALIGLGSNAPPFLDPNEVNSFTVVRMPKVIDPRALIAPQYSGPFIIDGRDV